ncbi:MAG: putative competence protein ComEC [Actinomycetota bacterium]
MPPGKDSLAEEASAGTARSYGAGRTHERHRASVVAAAVVLWLATVAGRRGAAVAGPLPVAVPFAVTACIASVAWVTRARSGSRAWMFVLLAVAGACGGAREWSAVPVPTGPCGGWVDVVTDPRGQGAHASVVVHTDGHRVRASAHGPDAFVLASLRAGERAWVEGDCGPVEGGWRPRELVNHVTGRMAVHRAGGLVLEGGAFARAANRVRDLVARGTARMAATDRALFLGLVMGDDSAQSRTMIDDFRGSGLSHLCSASGQNVAFLMAAAGPLLRRLTPAWRLAATLLVVAMFVFLTRAEPSVLRAAAMATVAAVNMHAGRPSNGRRVLAVAVCVLLVIDPMLAFSVGFMLSVGATAGLAWLSALIARRLGVPAVVASTLAAQAGTLPVALAVFGRVPLISVVANPLAVPVAGLVMLVGLPVAIGTAFLPDLLHVPVCALLTVPVRFVAWVASTGADVEPHGTAALVGWCVLCVAGAVRWFRCRRVAGWGHGGVGHHG